MHSLRDAKVVIIEIAVGKGEDKEFELGVKCVIMRWKKIENCYARLDIVFYHLDVHARVP